MESHGISYVFSQAVRSIIGNPNGDLAVDIDLSHRTEWFYLAVVTGGKPEGIFENVVRFAEAFLNIALFEFEFRADIRVRNDSYYRHMRVSMHFFMNQRCIRFHSFHYVQDCSHGLVLDLDESYRMFSYLLRVSSDSGHGFTDTTNLA